MSHNITTVENTPSDSSGDINLSISDLVSGSVGSNNIVKYTSGAWGTTGLDATPVQGYGYHYLASGGSGGSYVYSTGDRYIWRGYSNFNEYATGFAKANSTSTFTPLNNTRWWMGFTIPAGKWLVTWQFNVYMSSSTAYSTWRFATAPNSSASSYTYHSASSYVKGTSSRFGGLIRCVVDLSTASFGCLVNQSRSGSIRISPSGSAHYVNATTVHAL